MQVFKIMTDVQWAAMQKAGVWRGSADDKRDGYIHLSTSQQLVGTLALHFANATEPLMLVAIDANTLGDKLKWEESTGGETFPHLYYELGMPSVRWASTVPRQSEGVYSLPPQAFVSDPTS